MALDLVDKRDPSRTQSLSVEERHAIRVVAGGEGDEEHTGIVLAVMERARSEGLWLRCDCRTEGGRRPLVAPCRNHRGTDWWRVLAGRHTPHEEGCVFHRTHGRRRDVGRWNGPPKKAPKGNFEVLRDRAEEQRVSRPSGRSEEEGEQTHVRLSALSQRLLMLMERSGLNRLPPVDTVGDYGQWQDAIREVTTQIEIAPGCPLSDLWFTHIRMWKGRFVHTRIRAAAEDWPARHKPQGFLCWMVWNVDANGVGTSKRRDRVDVVSGVGRPVVGRNPIPPPYLFIGAVGMQGSIKICGVKRPDRPPSERGAVRSTSAFGRSAVDVGYVDPTDFDAS